MEHRWWILLVVCCAIALAGPVAALEQPPAMAWNTTLGGNSIGYGYVVQQTSDGGYVVAGAEEAKSNNGDVGLNQFDTDDMVVKLNGAGQIVWNKTFGGSGHDRATSVQQTSDGGYVVGGYTYSNDGDVGFNHGYVDGWVVKLDGAGQIAWNTTLGGLNSDHAYAVRQTSDGGYIIAGDTTSNQSGDVGFNHGYADGWMVKLDSAGQKVWNKTVGGSSIDGFGHVQQTSDGGYIIAGHTYSKDGDVGINYGWSDIWVVKLNAAGQIAWNVTLGRSGFDGANSVEQTSDGGYIIAGSTESNDGDVDVNQDSVDVWVVKLDGAGQIAWNRTLGGSEKDYASAMRLTSDGGYIVAGTTVSNQSGDVGFNHGGEDAWVVKLDSAGQKIWNKTLGGSSHDHATSVQQTGDGGYVVAGWTYTNDTDVGFNHEPYDYWVVKLSDDGSTPVAGNEFPGVLVMAIIVGAVTLVYDRNKKRLR